MDLIGDYMSRHHGHCDEAFARAEECAVAADSAGLAREGGHFLSEMARHIGLEEDVLFPAFEDRTGMTNGPTATMRLEHEQMRAMCAQMRGAIEGKDAAAYLDAAETLLLLMQQHNMKEESMMYPMLDQALGDDARKLLDRLEAVQG